VLHSAIAGIVFYAWAQRRRLPSGRAKRRLLAVLLILPLITAAVPGRAGVAFRERLAWLDSRPVLAIPLFWGLRARDAVVAAAAMMVAVTIGQELLPVLRRRRPRLDAPESLVQSARRLPGWERCQVMLTPGDEVALATGGRPGRPRLIVSRGALTRLAEDQLDMVLRHENAHWQGGRWIRAHALFLVRLLQCFNPVALLAFREYCLELEIECDAAAVAGRDARLLVRTLLMIYETTAPRDIAARSALRKRAAILLGDSPLDDDALPTPTLVAAAGILLVMLPWLV
jgi:Zn-dependent protease with chaperone function